MEGDAEQFSADLDDHHQKDQLIRRCEATLKSYATDFGAGHDREKALVAFEGTMALLLELRDTYPTRRGDIDAVLASHGHPRSACP